MTEFIKFYKSSFVFYKIMYYMHEAERQREGNDRQFDEELG